jgi:hypothetical protein
MTAFAPRPLAAPPEQPVALAPPWARLLIGTVAGAALAPLFFDARQGVSVNRDLLVAPFLALVGLAAGLAADLDRRRPRALVGAATAIIYGGVAWLEIAMKSFDSARVAIGLALAAPFAAGALRAAAGREGRPLLRGGVCFAFTLATAIAASALIFVLGIDPKPFEISIFGAVTGAAATAGLVASGWGLRQAWPIAARRGSLAACPSPREAERRSPPPRRGSWSEQWVER